MVGEFFSGGVCQKENGENCSAEAITDGRLTRAKCLHADSWRLAAGVKVVFFSLKPRVCACKRFLSV